MEVSREFDFTIKNNKSKKDISKLSTALILITGFMISLSVFKHQESKNYQNKYESIYSQNINNQETLNSNYLKNLKELIKSIKEHNQKDIVLNYQLLKSSTFNNAELLQNSILDSQLFLDKSITLKNKSTVKIDSKTIEDLKKIYINNKPPSQIFYNTCGDSSYCGNVDQLNSATSEQFYNNVKNLNTKLNIK